MDRFFTRMEVRTRKIALLAVIYAHARVPLLRSRLVSGLCTHRERLECNVALAPVCGACFAQINNAHNELQKANPLRINSVAERNCPEWSKISSDLLQHHSAIFSYLSKNF
jgi:hypothetical protein